MSNICLCNLAKLSSMQNDTSLYCTDCYPCFCRIRGDQQHFVRRDELKVCSILHNCVLMGRPFFFKNLSFCVTLTPPLFLRLLGRSSLLCCMTSMRASWRPSHINLAAEAPRKLMNWARELVMSRPTVTYGYHPPLHRREGCFKVVS